MIRLHWSTGPAGPRIRRDPAWYATVGALVAYMAWQALVGLAAVTVFLDRAGVASCPVEAPCRLVADWSDGFVGFVALALMAISVGVVVVVYRIAVAAWRRTFWVPLACRVVGWATLVGGIVTVLGWGLPWLAIGLWLVVAARRLRYDAPERVEPDVIEGERV